MCVSFLGLYVNRPDFQKNGSIFNRPLLQPEIIIRIHVKKKQPHPKTGLLFKLLVLAIYVIECFRSKILSCVSQLIFDAKKLVVFRYAVCT
jgi:hypothetical protein